MVTHSKCALWSHGKRREGGLACPSEWTRNSSVTSGWVRHMERVAKVTCHWSAVTIRTIYRGGNTWRQDNRAQAVRGTSISMRAPTRAGILDKDFAVLVCWRLTHSLTQIHTSVKRNHMFPASSEAVAVPGQFFFFFFFNWDWSLFHWGQD